MANRQMTPLALALMAVPCAFGVIRFAATVSDCRYLVIAAASTCGALLMLRRQTRGGGVAKRLGAALAAATLLAALASIAVGARSIISVGVVALGFALCSVSGAALLVWSRSQRGPLKEGGQ